MRAAQSYPLDPSATRPEKPRQRLQRSVRKRIRSSVSAGPTIAFVQRGNRLHRNVAAEKQLVCSVSADVSSISSSNTDSSEEPKACGDVTSATLERIMHAKHKVVRRAREQMITLVNNDLLAAPKDDVRSQLLRPNFPSGYHNDSQLSPSASNLNRASVNYDLDRRRDICEEIAQDDEQKPFFDGKISSNGRKPTDTHTDDGRILDRSEKRFCEYSPCEFDGKPNVSSHAFHTLINRRFTRKTNKFFVPFTNIEEGDSMTKKFEVPPKIDENVSAELDGAKLGLYHSRLKNPFRISDEANTEPSVKTFYENPILKDPSGSSMLPMVIECKSDKLTTCRSTNTTPVTSRSESTSTVSFEKNIEEKTANRAKRFHCPLHVIQPLLFVLAVFTVSMSGAYVGVLVASATCASYTGVEYEPGILQWLFSSGRQVRAF